ncbi:MAG: glycosyltransferase [Agriterribacter sp.]
MENVRQLTCRDRRKGIYIIAETGCLQPGSGANIHIEVGIKELEKNFEISRFHFCDPYKEILVQNTHQVKSINPFLKSLRQSLKWTYVLLKNHLRFFEYLREIKKESPVFIYERAAYLNYNGILIAKLLKIPHFYEVNGILAFDAKPFYPWIFNKISFFLERTAYLNTKLGFFVGGINEYFKIPSHKFVIIQNGIHENFTSRFEGRKNEDSGKINIVFIGHVMPHHRLDVLYEGMKLVKFPHRFCVHLIGSNLETIQDKFPADIQTISYGVMSHEQIEEKISDFNVGIITFALPYYSNVKAFMYGAAKLAVVLPGSKNFENIFDSSEVMFFKNADPSDLADKLNYIENNSSILPKYGENIYKKIKSEFTWEQIFNKITSEIKRGLPPDTTT